jgi:hypothetical protein
VQEFATDNDAGDLDSLSLSFLTFPDSATQGRLGFIANAGDADLTPLTTGVAQVKPGAPWQYFFEPLPNTFSANCDASGNCDPFATATFEITDRTNLKTVAPCTLTIYVIPVNDPPTCIDMNSPSR